MPLAFMGGLTAMLVVRDSPLTAAAVVTLVFLPFMYFTLRWSLATVVTLFEGLSGGAALRRSAQLSGARFWLFSFQFIVYNVAVIVPSVILSLACAKVVPAWSNRMFATAASGMLIAPFSYGLYLALYRREFARGVPAPESAPA
jgi:hypothetical protein